MDVALRKLRRESDTLIEHIPTGRKGLKVYCEYRDLVLAATQLSVHEFVYESSIGYDVDKNRLRMCVYSKTNTAFICKLLEYHLVGFDKLYLASRWRGEMENECKKKCEKELGEALRLFSRYKKISLPIGGCDLLESLQGNLFLEELYIYGQAYPVAARNFVDALPGVLASLPHLVSLSLGYSLNSLLLLGHLEVVLRLLFAIKTHSALQKVEIECKTKEKKIEKAIRQILLHNRTLKEFTWTDYTGKLSFGLIEALEQNTTIETFYLGSLNNNAKKWYCRMEKVGDRNYNFAKIDLWEIMRSLSPLFLLELRFSPFLVLEMVFVFAALQKVEIEREWYYAEVVIGFEKHRKRLVENTNTKKMVEFLFALLRESRTVEKRKLGQ